MGSYCQMDDARTKGTAHNFWYSGTLGMETESSEGAGSSIEEWQLYENVIRFGEFESSLLRRIRELPLFYALVDVQQARTMERGAQGSSLLHHFGENVELLLNREGETYGASWFRSFWDHEIRSQLGEGVLSKGHLMSIGKIEPPHVIKPTAKQIYDQAMGKDGLKKHFKELEAILAALLDANNQIPTGRNARLMVESVRVEAWKKDKVARGDDPSAPTYVGFAFLVI